MNLDQSRMCAGKVGHASRSQAKRTLKQFVKRQGRDMRAFNVYRCIHCGFWHTGHFRDEQPRRQA